MGDLRPCKHLDYTEGKYGPDITLQTCAPHFPDAVKPRDVDVPGSPLGRCEWMLGSDEPHTFCGAWIRCEVFGYV